MTFVTQGQANFFLPYIGSVFNVAHSRILRQVLLESSHNPFQNLTFRMTELQVNVIFRSNPMTATVGQIGQSRNLSQHPLPLTAEFLGLKPAFIKRFEVHTHIQGMASSSSERTVNSLSHRLPFFFLILGQQGLGMLQHLCFDFLGHFYRRSKGKFRPDVDPVTVNPRKEGETNVPSQRQSCAKQHHEKTYRQGGIAVTDAEIECLPVWHFGKPFEHPA